MRSIVLIAHNLRSCHNVGSLLRTAEGLGVECVYLTGYSPYPAHPKDSRLLHVAQKISKQISKTALGAETLQAWEHRDVILPLIRELHGRGYLIAAVEQTAEALDLPGYKPPDKITLIVGREVEGIEEEILKAVDQTLAIPMLGHKESFNVVQAAAMALYHCRFV